jgi:hypothetical protein
MGQFSANFLSVGGTISDALLNVSGTGAFAEFIVGPTDYPAITEIGVVLYNFGGLAVSIGVGVPSAAGIGPQYLAPAFGVYNPNDVQGGISIATAWQKPPGVPSKFFRRAIPQTGQGQAAYVFRFPRGLRLAPSSSLVLWNSLASAGGRQAIYDGWLEYDN